MAYQRDITNSDIFQGKDRVWIFDTLDTDGINDQWKRFTVRYFKVRNIHVLVAYQRDITNSDISEKKARVRIFDILDTDGINILTAAVGYTWFLRIEVISRCHVYYTTSTARGYRLPRGADIIPSAVTSPSTLLTKFFQVRDLSSMSIVVFVFIIIFNNILGFPGCFVSVYETSIGREICTSWKYFLVRRYKFAQMNHNFQVSNFRVTENRNRDRCNLKSEDKR